MPLIIKQINTMIYADAILATGKLFVESEITLSNSGNSASDWCFEAIRYIIIKKLLSSSTNKIIPIIECQEIFF